MVPLRVFVMLSKCSSQKCLKVCPQLETLRLFRLSVCIHQAWFLGVHVTRKRLNSRKPKILNVLQQSILGVAQLRSVKWPSQSISRLKVQLVVLVVGTNYQFLKFNQKIELIRTPELQYLYYKKVSRVFWYVAWAETFLFFSYQFHAYNLRNFKNTMMEKV